MDVFTYFVKLSNVGHLLLRACLDIHPLTHSSALALGEIPRTLEMTPDIKGIK